VTDVLANVLKHEIDWTALPDATPAGLERVLRRCLERRPADRIRDMGDVRWELEHPDGSGGVAPGADAAADAGGRRSRWVLPWFAGAALGVVLAAGLAAVLWPASDPPRTVRSFLVPPDGTTFNFHGSVGGPVLSPDGRRLVFAAQDRSGRTSLWVQPLDSDGARELTGTEGASYPFWSPDGRSIGFFIPGKLRRIDVDGGPPQTVCDAANGRGGSWSPDGSIVFAPNVFSGLSRVVETGGTPSPVVELDSSKGQSSARWPHFLPDGRRFLFWAGGPLNSGEVDTDGIYLGSLDGSKPSFLFPADSNALYAPPGYLLFLREQVLMARRFDAATGEPVGEAVPLIEQVANPENYRLGDFSVSREGTMVCQTGETGLNSVVWLDAAGQQVATVGEPVAIDGLRLSPDGKVLAEQVSDARSKNIDLWLVDLERDVRTRFTFDAGVEIAPVWSPDGDRIAFSANPNGHLDLFVKNANGSGVAEPVLESEAGKYAADWSPDGRFLSVTAIDPHGSNGADIWIVPLEGDAEPRPFLATPFNEANAMFSPDGRWLAYASAESGRSEVYVTPFPGPGGKWQISQEGGRQPLWRRDGGAVYFRAPDGSVWEAAVADRGGAVDVGTPMRAVVAPGVSTSSLTPSYAVSPEGDRFLVLVPVESSTTPLTLITHWTSLLRR
jgi:Tol biopolymer transport system component